MPASVNCLVGGRLGRDGYRAPVPANEPQIDAILDAMFDSVRSVVSDIRNGGSEDARIQNMELFDRLATDHGQGAAIVAATLLAEAVANGFLGIAAGARHPVEEVLDTYERQLREHTDFSVIIGRGFFLDEGS